MASMCQINKNRIEVVTILPGVY